MPIVSIRENPALCARATAYFQAQWASEESMMVYDDAIARAIEAPGPLPQWYVMMHEEEIIGCAGLIPNDFISRCELMPWLCALYIDPAYRGQGRAMQLIDHIAADARRLGFNTLHLCTDSEGFYEKAGFSYDGPGYHPWGECSRVYTLSL